MANPSPAPRFSDHDECDAFTASVAEQIVAEQISASPRLFRKRTYPAGSFIWMAHDSPIRVFVIVSGRVEVTALDRKGTASLIRNLEPGEMAGELCFCKYQRETLRTQGTAITRCEIAEASYPEFQRALQRDAAFSARMLESLCGRVALAEQRTALLSIRGARERLATLLLQLGERQGARKSITVSHRELALLACLTRPHVTVLMTRLRDCGCLSYKRGSALTLNGKRLRLLLEE